MIWNACLHPLHMNTYQLDSSGSCSHTSCSYYHYQSKLLVQNYINMFGLLQVNNCVFNYLLQCIV